MQVNTRAGFEMTSDVCLEPHQSEIVAHQSVRPSASATSVPSWTVHGTVGLCAIREAREACEALAELSSPHSLGV